MGDSDENTPDGDASGEGMSDDVKLPRDPMGRYIVVVLAVALLTFLLTVMAVKVHRHFTQETAVPSAR